MSRYQLDKCFREILLSDEQRDRFMSSPDAYLDGRDLTDAERRALIERDYGALYATGGHPFILWGWARRVATPAELASIARRYGEAIAPHGYPDFAT